MIYDQYTKGRVGVFFGLSTGQLVLLAVAGLPILPAISARAWPTVAAMVLIWAVVVVLVTVRIRGRSTVNWCLASVLFSVGKVTGTSRFRSNVATGQPAPANVPDLPDVMKNIAIHDGPVFRLGGGRIALVQNPKSRDWAIVARIVHPGLGISDDTQRQAQGQGLAELLESCARGEVISEVQFMTRTVPEDGAEYREWVTRHQVPGVVDAADETNATLQEVLTQASVRTETYVCVVVPEHRLARDAKQAGGGLAGRGKVMMQVAEEVSGLLTAMGVTRVQWLSSESLAVQVRTGFAPGDRASIVDLVAQGSTQPVRWSVAGPSGTDPARRYYSHDAWNSSACSIGLPQAGAAMGALAQVLQSPQPGVRRSVCVVYPIVPASKAAGKVRGRRFAHETANQLRAKAGVATDAADRRDGRRVNRADEQMAAGAAWVSPYAFAAVTSPKTVAAGEQLAALQSSIRRSGFDALPTDLSHDTGFVIATIPVGISLRKVGA